MQTFTTKPGFAASKILFLATDDYSGSAGRWKKGDAVLVADPLMADWLEREAPLARSTAVPNAVPIIAPVAPAEASAAVPVVAPVEASAEVIESVPVAAATPEPQGAPEPAAEAPVAVVGERREGKPRRPKGGDA